MRKILEHIVFVDVDVFLLTGIGIRDPPLITLGVEMDVLAGFRINQKFVPD